MDVEQRYQKIMQELERGGRGLERYSYEEM
jgi:hypothetical protein